MKPICMFLALILSLNLWGQQTLTADTFLAKSKNQRKVSLFTGIPGASLFTVGTILFLSEFGDGLPGGGDYNEQKVNTGEILMIAGGVLLAISIPFGIASKINKKKAMSLSFKNIFVPQAEKSEIVYMSQPSLCLKISL